MVSDGGQEFARDLMELNRRLREGEGGSDLIEKRVSTFREWDRAANSIGMPADSDFLQVLQDSIELSPQDSSLRLMRGTVLARTLAENVQAKEDLNHVLVFEPNNTLALLNLALIALDEQDLAEAISRAKETTKLDPADVQAWGLLSRAYELSGDLHNSLEAARQAVLLSPTASHTRQLARILRRVGLSDEAASVLRQQIQVDQESEELHRELGITLAKLGHVEEAERELKTARALLDREDPLAEGTLLIIDHHLRRLIRQE